jgi:ABC-type branched-subunit amino acid transport system substrate-binding protein
VTCGYLPDLKEEYQYSKGDLILGGIFPLADNCQARKVTSLGLVMLAEAMPFAIKEINARNDILPNIKLGYAIFDSCFSDRNTLAQTLYMVPDKNPKSECTTYKETCSNPYFDVVGVIGPQISAGAVLQSHLLSFFHIPQISAYATTDVLSVKDRHPYFLRTVPPDKWQIIALVELIRHFNWTYISAVRQMGSYGDGIEQVKEMVEAHRVCFAVIKQISKASSQSELDDIVTALVSKKRARVIIFYCLFEQALAVMEAMNKRGVLGDFVIVGSDGLGMLVQDTKHSKNANLTHGLLVVTQYSNSVPKFDNYFKQLTSTADIKGSIILEQFWEYKFNCSMTGGTNKCSDGLRLSENHGFFSYRPASMVIDAVYSFAYALHALIQAECATATPATVRECIKGKKLLECLKNVSFDGTLGMVQFDKNGDIRGKYEVRNVYFDNGHFDSRRVAELDTATETLSVNEKLIQWHPAFSDFVAGSDRIPESVCSKPCSPGQQRIQESVKCCWTCRPCRAGEITNSSETQCIPCEIYKWPDEYFRMCIDIEPDYIRWTSSLAIIMSIIAMLGIISCLVVMVIFYRIRADKLIKASSIELMYLILAGVTLGLVVVFTFLAKPSIPVCYAQHFGFNITFTITYCPLLAKTRRIYAIFELGRKSKKPPRFIHLSAQLVICGTFIAIQVSDRLKTICLTPSYSSDVSQCTARLVTILTSNKKKPNNHWNIAAGIV